MAEYDQLVFKSTAMKIYLIMSNVLRVHITFPVKVKSSRITKYLFLNSIHPLQPSVAHLYPLKTLENF